MVVVAVSENVAHVAFKALGFLGVICVRVVKFHACDIGVVGSSMFLASSEKPHM